MGREIRPLCTIGLAIVIVGFVAGTVFMDVPVGNVLWGLAALTGLVVILFLLSRRHEPDSHYHDYDATVDVR